MTKGLGSPLFCKTVNFSVKELISTCISWHLLSKLCTRVLLVSTLLISRIVSVLSGIPSTSNCSLFLLFKNYIIRLACSGICPNRALVFWISPCATFTKSVFSYITMMDGQISFIAWMILAQRIFLISTKGLSKVSSYSSVFTLFSKFLISLIFSR